MPLLRRIAVVRDAVALTVGLPVAGGTLAATPAVAVAGLVESSTRVGVRAARVAVGLAATPAVAAAGLVGPSTRVGVRAARTAVGLAATPAVAAAGLVGPSSRAGARVAREAVGATAALTTDPRAATRTIALRGARALGTVVTGADPLPDGQWRHLADVGRGLVQPPLARRSRRVWAAGGHAQVELVPPPGADEQHLRRALRRQLERLDGVEWAAVNDVAGRVLVAFDDHKLSVEDVIGTITAVERARGSRQVSSPGQDHPADLEPLMAAAAQALIDLTAVGVAGVAQVLPVPALTRHATLVLALIDSQRWIKAGLVERFGEVGADLALTGASALLHASTQSPTVPAINAVAALQRAAEVRARRQVWCRRVPELVGPEPEGSPAPRSRPGERPTPLPPGPIESYSSKMGPISLAAAVGLLPLTARPGRSADLLKALTPKAATSGRESFAATLDLLLCRQGVVPLDGSAYRRLDRVDTVVVDADALCTGAPAVLTARAEAEDWDTAAVWSTAARLLTPPGNDGGARTGAARAGGTGKVRLGPPAASADAPGGQVRTLYAGRRRVGVVTVAAELDPHADALLTAVTGAGHRLVLTEHVGTTEIAGTADEVVPAGQSLLETVRRLQSDGHGVLLVSATDGPALLAADVAVAPALPGRPLVCGADLVTRPGLADACRIVAATPEARAVSERCVHAALTGNVLGGLLAAVGSPRRGQRKATTPGKTATLGTMGASTWAAVRVAGRPAPPPTVHTPWHALPPEDAQRRVAGSRPAAEDGSSVISVPLQWVGRRTLVRVPLRLGRTVAAELSDPLTPVLGTGAAATAVLGEVTDAVLVGGVTVGNAVISGLQRLRAETALESLLLEQDVRMRREADGGCEDVAAGDLRPGDVVLVEPGDVVVADARLLDASDLEVDESGLTGESLSVAKSVPATPGAALADRTCMLFDGTTVVAGTGRAVVVAVGDATQAGRVARAAGSAAPPAGVQARLGELTRAVLPWTLAGGAAVTAFGVLWRRPLREAVAGGVAVAVAAVPEGLPLVATVAQQAAARRLSHRGAVVRSARVLEALGRVDTVCFDKTGTLTENRLRVVELVPLGPGEPLDDKQLLELAVTGVAQGDDTAHETDRAIAEAGDEQGVPVDGAPDADLPFAASRGFSVTLRAGRLVVKGAPEVVLRRCTEDADVRRRVEELAGQGLRVLAVAEREVDGSPDDLEQESAQLTLRGLVGLADTVRDSTAQAVEQLCASGVRVVVATGDHPETAAAIAAQAGVPHADRVVTGAELARASGAEQVRMAREVSVFARLSPEQKVALVAALQRGGATLAMTGDGVNDAAAIRLADVGIGVSGAESPAARTAADLVLTDADLSRLVDAIAEGRAMWSSVRDAVAVLVGGNAGEVAFTVLGTALGGRAPLGTRQLLLVNLLTDMFPALAMAVSAPRSGTPGDVAGALADHPLAAVLLAGPQRDFLQAVRTAVLVRGAATTAGATGAWAVGRVTGPYARASSMGLAALITTQLCQTAWAGRRSPLVLVTAAGSFALLVGVVQTPGVSRFFGCTPLDPVAWLVVLGSSATCTLGAELLPRLLER